MRCFHIFDANAYHLFHLFNGYLVGILQLVLIFSCMEFKYSTTSAPCSVMFACWVPMQSHVVALVPRLALAKILVLYWVKAFYALRGAVFGQFELLRGF